MPQSSTEFKTAPGQGGPSAGSSGADVEALALQGQSFADVKQPTQYLELVEKVSYARARHRDLVKFRETWGEAVGGEDFQRAPGPLGPDSDHRAPSAKPVAPIDRAAQYPDSHILHFSILAAIVLVEGLANAYFFSKGSDLGLLGGWLQAITVAFTNVIAAFFFIGYLGLRNMANPHRPVCRTLGALSVVSGIAAIIALNLSAAHYRDLLEFNADALAMAGVTGQVPVLDPVRAAFAAPFQIQTLEALLLLILGLTFAAIAAYKGRTFDDAVPGYGQVTREARKAADDLKKAMVGSWKKRSDMGPEEADKLADAIELHEQLCEDLAGPTEHGRARF